MTHRLLILPRVDDVNLSNVHPKKAFIIDALDKEIRLSFSKRIKGTLPEPYQGLISEEKEKDTPDFKFDDENTPFAAQGREIAQLIRKKASNDEFTPPLEAIEQQAMESGVANPQLASTDAFVTSICWVGSKSMSHVLACIDRTKERLLQFGSLSSEARKQIITSVMTYWQHQEGVGIIILDKLLNYQILTPESVIEWALIDKVDRGTSLAKACTFELVNKTVQKVCSRVRSIVHAIRQPGLDDAQKLQLQQTLNTELENTKQLFITIQDAVSSIRDGHQDEMIESSDALRAEDEELLKAWGRKWARAFERISAVEESWVRDELAKPIPEPAPLPEPVVKDTLMNDDPDQTATNGHATNGHNGTSAEVVDDGDGIE